MVRRVSTLEKKYPIKQGNIRQLRTFFLKRFGECKNPMFDVFCHRAKMAVFSRQSKLGAKPQAL